MCDGATEGRRAPTRPRFRIGLIAAITALGALASFAIIAAIPRSPLERHVPTEAEISAAVRTSLENCAHELARDHPVVYLLESDRVPPGLTTLDGKPVEVVSRDAFVRRFREDEVRPMLVGIRVKPCPELDKPGIIVRIGVGDAAWRPGQPHQHGQSYGYTYRCRGDHLASEPSDISSMTE